MNCKISWGLRKHKITIKFARLCSPTPPPDKNSWICACHWSFNRPTHVKWNYKMFISVPGPNYPLTIEAPTGEGGGGTWSHEINLLVLLFPKNQKMFPGVPCPPVFSLFACSSQKLHLYVIVPLSTWYKCPFTLFPKTTNYVTSSALPPPIILWPSALMVFHPTQEQMFKMKYSSNS